MLVPGVLLFIVWLHSCDLLHRFRDYHEFLLTPDDHTHQRCNSGILYVLCCLLAHLCSFPAMGQPFFLKKNLNFFMGPLMPCGDVCRARPLGFRTMVDLSHACLIDCAMVSVDLPLSASPADPLMTSMSADPLSTYFFK